SSHDPLNPFVTPSRRPRKSYRHFIVPNLSEVCRPIKWTTGEAEGFLAHAAAAPGLAVMALTTKAPADCAGALINMAIWPVGDSVVRAAATRQATIVEAGAVVILFSASLRRLWGAAPA